MIVITTHIEERQKRQLRDLANANGGTTAHYIRQAIDFFLDHELSDTKQIAKLENSSHSLSTPPNTNKER